MTARRLYVGTIVIAGACVLSLALARLPDTAGGYYWLLLAVLTWMSSPLALRVPGAGLTITVSESLSLIIVFGYGWEAAAVTLAVDGLVTSLRQRALRLHRALFNAAEPVLSMAACGLVLNWVSGMAPHERLHAPLVQLIAPGFAGASTYLLLNGLLTTGALALETRTSAWATWRRHARWLVLDYLGATSLALLVVAASSGSGVLSVLPALPLIGALYYTYRNSIRRAEEALQYAERLNRLYLGTVESLATAIDAKDEVTHGHIQRVRTLALRLAELLGIRDEGLIKALETGALLHDVGKLGVPDHILNKPGPLTPGEYEQIKRHTEIGADIVSRVDYPYPVGPIVRHHHENWDGTGYPDGLRGEAIPIGARILAVIDCYDALTSDRPYRLAMSHEAAAQIVAARRGTMYDPAVVDAFLALSRDQVPPGKQVAAAGAAVPTPLRRFERVDLSPAAAGRAVLDRPGLLVEVQAHAARLDRDAVLGLLAAHLPQLTPASTCALFVPGEGDIELRLVWAVGEAVPAVAALQVLVGRGLTGWVAAHRQVILNGNGALELGPAARSQPVPPIALSVPLELEGGRLVGVLTLYSPARSFTAADRDLLVALAPHLAPCLTAPGEQARTDAAAPQLRVAPAEAAAPDVPERMVS